MKLFNSLYRKLEDFKSVKAGQVSLYTCGPTVYDDQTIGNLRTYVFYDTLKRILMANGYEVKHVMNITDVGHLTSDADEGEDKLEKGATEAGKTVWQVAEHYIKLFRVDLKRLNILKPEIHRATDLVDQQIEMVKLLLDKGFAYQTEQAVYFDVSQLNDYGKLTGQKLSEKEIAARQEVVTDKNKHSPQDFAVWFFTVGRFTGHEMKWASPWGDGFPGWHLECSAIIHQTLGDPIDIHAGAVDLIGTHHTNEMAQTEAAFGHDLANYWLHSEHLLVDGQKMSKSLNNFLTLEDIIVKGYEPMALRLLFLQAHYRSQLNFTLDSIEAAAKNLMSLRAFADLRFQAQPDATLIVDDYFQNQSIAMLDNLANDLATPAALAKLDEVIDWVSGNGIHPTRTLDQLSQFLQFLDQVFGLGLLESKDVSAQQKELIAKREEARASNDWVKADQLREQLKKQAIELNDTELGPVWYRA